MARTRRQTKRKREEKQEEEDGYVPESSGDEGQTQQNETQSHIIQLTRFIHCEVKNEKPSKRYYRGRLVNSDADEDEKHVVIDIRRWFAKDSGTHDDLQLFRSRAGLMMTEVQWNALVENIDVIQATIDRVKNE